MNLLQCLVAKRADPGMGAYRRLPDIPLCPRRAIPTKKDPCRGFLPTTSLLLGKCIRRFQEEMVKAWDQVRILE